jgi:hypothetical protein
MEFNIAIRQGSVAMQFRLLADYAGIPEKQTNAIMSLMVSKTEQVTNLIDASFLKDVSVCLSTYFIISGNC